ncbi:MAG: hypothetical protein AB1458_16175 [Bacteroidota bacterium]
MKTPLFLIALLLSGRLLAQTLNPYGHFTGVAGNELAYKTVHTAQGHAMEINGLVLQGTAAFTTPHGILTLGGHYENAPSFVKLYAADGTELISKSFTQTINLSLSPGGNFCAFHDMEKI